MSKNKGQSLFEIIVAIAVGAIIIGGATTAMVVALRSNKMSAQTQRANELAQEILNNSRSYIEANWASVYNLEGKGPNSYFYLSQSATSSLTLNTGTTTANLFANNATTTYVNWFAIEDVYRTADGTATTTVGSNIKDPFTQQVTAHVAWSEGGSTREIDIDQYVSRGRSDAFSQSSWSGGTSEDAFTAGSGINYGNTSSTDVSSGCIVLTGGSCGAQVLLSTGSVNVTEGGATSTYTIVLSSAPTADVEISVSGDADATTTPTSLTFTTSTWSSAQTVTVTAVDDDITEGTHFGTISHTASSTDTNYDGVSIDSVSASITDNDGAGVTVSATSTAVTEGGATSTYTVVLTSKPTANVNINISSNADYTRDPTVLVFTTSTWDTPQQVTITATDDDLDEDEEVREIAHTAVSTDPNYNGISIQTVEVTITDNDTAGVTVSESSLAVTEGGATDNYTVVLDTQPTATVNISVSSDGDYSPSSSTLVFLTSNWDTPQQVTITAVDDSEDETSPENKTITHNASSGDSDYNGISVDSISLAITDNDAEVISSPASEADDGYCEGTGTKMFYTNVTYFGSPLIGNDYESTWFRFPSVSVPQGATINSAVISFGNKFQLGDPNGLIYGIDEDNHTAPTNYLTWEDDHTLHTSASVAWTVQYPAGTPSPDIKTVIQEIVNRAGWSSGNALGIHIDLNGPEFSEFIEWDDYGDGNPAELTISYST